MFGKIITGLLMVAGNAVADSGVPSSDSNRLIDLYIAEESVGGDPARLPFDDHVRDDFSRLPQHCTPPGSAAVLVREALPELGALAVSGLAGVGLIIHRRRMWRVS